MFGIEMDCILEILKNNTVPVMDPDLGPSPLPILKRDGILEILG
jgi:hypothetical protein